LEHFKKIDIKDFETGVNRRFVLFCFFEEMFGGKSGTFENFDSK
jgi:hypothetical protein